MPSRSLVLAIVFFWVATSGWFFHRDLWPRLRPGQPPPYTIRLADEVLRNEPPILWSVFRGDKQIGRAATRLIYRDADDTFELHSNATLDLGKIGLFKISSPKMSCMYRVTRDGQLSEIIADITITIGGVGLMGGLGGTATAHIGGEVKGQRFLPHGWLDWGGSTTKLPLEPVEVSSEVSVLNPLHPINRVTGLKKGQHWQMQLLNPLNDALLALLKRDPGAELLLQGQGGVRIVQAEVLPDTKFLRWKNREVPCLVIEYHSDDLTAQTWVREDKEEEGLVLRQEASFWGDKVIMVRDSKTGTP